MIRTAKQALAFVRKHRMVPMTPAGDLPSFVVAIAGGPVKGSWWGHPKGALIYDLANALHDSKEVHSVRLVDGKNTFVHRSLWPALYRVVTDPTWRRSKIKDLGAPARRLLSAVGKAGSLRLDSKSRKAKEQLTSSLLVDVTHVHTETGNHAAVLVDWKRWAKAGVKRAAKAMTFESAREALQSACRGRASC